MGRQLLFSAAAILLAALRPLSVHAGSLPTVDLGYAVNQAILNSTGNYYSFKNIPYAEPPLGELRFRLPIPPITINRTVNDGSNSRTCPQAAPAWFGYSIPLVLEYIASGTNGTAGAPPPSPPNPPASEDCLLLDVVVPTSIFDAHQAGTLAAPVPVLVWIHGGGYIQGWKDQENPAGLIASSVRNGKSGIVYVAINYRLGMFGFPPRQPFQWDVASNAGLYDQRLALEWVLFNIAKFGGDANQVTVIGESAGAGSIMLHLSAFGGISGATPFKRAIVQSPALKPSSNAALYSEIYQQFLTAANVSSIEDARQLPSTDLQGVNAEMVGNSPFASTVFGPNVDGIFIPAEPGNLLVQQKVDKSVQLIVAHNLNEGLLFTDPRINNQTGFEDYFAGFMPSASSATITKLATQIYPEDYSGTYPYTTPTERVALAMSEALVECWAFGLDLAYSNNTQAYQFGLFPGIHAQDTSYTFYNGETVDSLGLQINSSVATTMQAWITDYAESGNSGASTATQIPFYGTQATLLNITNSGFVTAKDPAATSRCQFWLTAFTS